MKRYTFSLKSTLVVVIMLMVSVMTFGQKPSSQHLTFKGVPITGTLIDYTLKMKENGFTHLATKDGTAILKGDFAGYKSCTVGVSTLKQKDLVHQIAVVFPDRETWSTLYSNYSSLKELLTEKYGKPTIVVEKFGDSNSDDKDDNAKMYEVKFDRCKYYTTWETEKGDIEVSIEHNSVINCFVKLAYFDKINGAIIRAKAKDDL
ncbi:hypothetical protein [Pedobacter agri]|uniref:hypothetical protein n=1 Tax=Pedobacter agri TaxID=454586 RepID=UPI002930F98F|nr:hypothetical protein [Pedobacter agri]